MQILTMGIWRLLAVIQYETTTHAFFNAMTTAFSPGIGIMTGFQNGFLAGFMTTIVVLLPALDSVLFGLQFSVWVIPKLHRFVRILNQVIILGTASLSVIPVLGNMIITNEYKTQLIETFDQDIKASVEEIDVYLVATIVMLPLMVCLSFYCAEKDESQMKIVTIPRGYEKLVVPTWFIGQMFLGYSTFLEKDNIEKTFGPRSFFVKQVAFVILNQIFTMQWHPSVFVNDNCTFHFLTGTVIIPDKEGKKVSPDEKSKVCDAIAPLRDILGTKEAEIVCSIRNCDINLENADLKAVFEITGPTKQFLQDNYNSQSQEHYVGHSVALNLYPNLKAAVALLVVTISLVVMDFWNVSTNSPLFCVTIAQAVLAPRCAALGKDQPDLTQLTSTRAVKVDGKKLVSVARDVDSESAESAQNIPVPESTRPNASDGTKLLFTDVVTSKVQSAKPATKTSTRDEGNPMDETGGHNKDNTNNTAPDQKPGGGTGKYVEGAGGLVCAVLYWLVTQND